MPIGALIPVLGKAWTWITANIWNIMKVILIAYGGWSAIQIGGALTGGITQTIQQFAPMFTMMFMFMLMLFLFQFFSIILDMFRRD